MAEMPNINMRPVASKHARPAEGIIEVSHPLGGCLISISPHRGNLSIHGYQTEPNVILSRAPSVWTIYDASPDEEKPDRHSAPESLDGDAAYVDVSDHPDSGVDVYRPGTGCPTAVAPARAGPSCSRRRRSLRCGALATTWLYCCGPLSPSWAGTRLPRMSSACTGQGRWSAARSARVKAASRRVMRGAIASTTSHRRRKCLQ